MAVRIAGRTLGAVSWWRRLRSDLVRPEAPTGPDERLFLIGSSIAIVLLSQVSDPGSVADLLVVSCAVCAFAIRAFVPAMPSEAFAVLVLVPVAVVVAHEGDLEGTFFLPVIMVLSASSHLGSLARASAILLLSEVATLVVAATSDSGINPAPWIAANLFTFVLGRTLRRQQGLIRDLEEARGALAAQAVAEERRRIARELHDLAGHTLAAMMLHVAGARHVLRRDVDEADRALLDAETVGRASLDQIRATVAALRTDERGTDQALPGTADIADLIDEYRRAGLVVDASLAGASSSPTGPTATALHRIAREALANVARHAPGNEVELRLDVAEDVVRLHVIDHGRPAAPPDAGAGHFGLVGMSERARALGGTLEAGPTADGWRVDATLPLPTTIRGQAVAP